MKYAVKQLFVVSAVCLAAGVANAANVVVPAGTTYHGTQFDGSLKLSLSADVLGAFDTTRVQVSAYAPGAVAMSKDTDGFYLQASSLAPLNSLTFDSSNNALTAASSKGGMTLTQPILKSVSSGGSLTITDLDVDVTHKQVYATLIGGNGVGTVNHLRLLNIASITGGAAEHGFNSNCGFYNDCIFWTPSFTLTGLSMTTEGFNLISQALGMQRIGSLALAGISDFGTITSTAVPEPTTCVLMGMGLVGVIAAGRRRLDSQT